MVLTCTAVTPLYWSSGVMTRFATWSSSLILKLVLFESLILWHKAAAGSSRIFLVSSLVPLAAVFTGSVLFLFLILTLMMFVD